MPFFQYNCCTHKSISMSDFNGTILTIADGFERFSQVTKEKKKKCNTETGNQTQIATFLPKVNRYIAHSKVAHARAARALR